MRTFGDIVPPSRRTSSTEPNLNNEPVRAPIQSNMPSGVFPFRSAGISILVVLAVITGLLYFSSAQVTITPTSTTVTVSGDYIATQGAGALPYEIISAQKVAVQSVEGSGTETVHEFASGVITIYNTQPKSQPLIAKTRFSTKNGLVFRINSPVTVPKGSADNPGTIQATVYADLPGESHNVGPSDFTLPGLSGGAAFSKVYAKSVQSMSGGISGTVPTVNDGIEESARQTLIMALKSGLETDLMNKVPEGYVLLIGAATTTFKALPTKPSSTTGLVDVRQEGTITGIIFPTEALAGAIASQTLATSYNGEPVSFKSNESLSFRGNIPEVDQDSYSFALFGEADLVYVVDPERIAAAVTGKNRDSAKVALSNYPEVYRASITLRPFWRQTFPEEPDSISVNIKE